MYDQCDLSHLFEDLALCCCVHSCQDPVNGGDGDHDAGGDNGEDGDHNDEIGDHDDGYGEDSTIILQNHPTFQILNVLADSINGFAVLCSRLKS